MSTYARNNCIAVNSNNTPNQTAIAGALESFGEKNDKANKATATNGSPFQSGTLFLRRRHGSGINIHSGRVRSSVAAIPDSHWTYNGVTTAGIR